MLKSMTILAAVALTGAFPSAAATLVHFEIGGEHSAAFDLREAPKPRSFVTGASFVVDGVRGVFEGNAGIASIRFFNDTLGGGLEIVGDFVGHYNQLYRGPEATPLIYTGDYQLIDAATGGRSGLIIYQTAGSVPEPTAWAMLIAGFAGIGAALRRRRIEVTPTGSA